MELDFGLMSVLGRHSQLYHVGMACHRLETAMEQIGASFDVSWTAVAVDSRPNLFTPAGPCSWTARRCHSIGSAVPFELLEGSPGSTWDTAKVVSTHHVAYWSADVGMDVRGLEAEGWAVEINIVDDAGNPTDFAYLTKPGCVRVELVDAQWRPAYLALTGQIAG
jgi:hypothetical protein